jgi:hypothetical protein
MPMHIGFQRAERVNADPDQLWQILTDYTSCRSGVAVGIRINPVRS